MQKHGNTPASSKVCSTESLRPISVSSPNAPPTPVTMWATPSPLANVTASPADVERGRAGAAGSSPATQKDR
jgi:hypothetical protein